ncbi:hypothetical protein F5Y04DRAFT_75651 [Hypomontagnella monticulosa]|nr:hypothetical protein F5Y04DRAFT_75651 [Hypomontagnella monticulosa]
MAFNLPRVLLVTGLFALRALAACSSYGVDYVNGGSYEIDSSSNDNFTFTTIFQGCDAESVKPTLIDPAGKQYGCSAISTTPAGEQVTSTCQLKYSAMGSGLYKIVISGDKIGVQRTIALTAGTPAIITITATPTVIVGVTSTPNATTIYKTISQTQTVALPPATITKPCDKTTQTVTITPKFPTVTSTYIITRTVTDKKVTKSTTTTVTKTASCHYLTLPTFTIPDPLPLPTICIGLACIGSTPDTVIKTGKRDVAAVAASTVTVTETTYTVTSTSTTVVPAQTTTENVYKTVTATVTPTPTTVCDDGPAVTVTITRPYATITSTSVGYTTTHIEATVWVGKTSYTTSTNKASATSCSRNGGWYGADSIASATATA